MLHITVIANEEKKKLKLEEKKIQGGVEVKNCREYRTLGANRGGGVLEDGWSFEKRKNWSAERRRVLQWHTGSLRYTPSLPISSVLLFLWHSLLSAHWADLEGKSERWAKTVDLKGNPIKRSLHLSSVHLTSSVIFQPKPPGADRNRPSHVNTNASLRRHSIVIKRHPPCHFQLRLFNVCTFSSEPVHVPCAFLAACMNLKCVWRWIRQLTLWSWCMMQFIICRCKQALEGFFSSACDTWRQIGSKALACDRRC